ncbi:serine protease, partial [Datura stramonium]|nr:serine protease [Datura stramonium]
VSILAGTLARLDRDAPQYKKDGYNDFNTFYMQAASGTKGGSSGSPVIDWQGRAVALNAGSKLSSASAFFLPLERVVRSLKFLQEGGHFSTNTWAAVTIPRGTLQVTFLHKGFDETRRLGVQRETEQLVRDSTPPTETGMLVVDSVVPGGPAHNHLEPGDVLFRMNGEVVTQFLKMETLLDDSVEKKIELQIERGGTPLTVDLLVNIVLARVGISLLFIYFQSFLSLGDGEKIITSLHQTSRQVHSQLFLYCKCDGPEKLSINGPSIADHLHSQKLKPAKKIIAEPFTKFINTNLGRQRQSMSYDRGE